MNLQLYDIKRLKYSCIEDLEMLMYSFLKIIFHLLLKKIVALM